MTQHSAESRCTQRQNMKQKLIGLSRRYVTALRIHLDQGPHASMVPALRLGRQAVALGLETLGLARIHEQALSLLKLSNSKNGLIKRAETFFTEAITPIMDTHRAARESKLDLNRITAKLSRRTVELAATNRQLQRGIIRRKSAECTLKKRGDHYTELLKDSLRLQEGLRHLTHKNLSAQENERQTISHQLQDEIVQTLLSIHVRLLTLKTAATGNTANLSKEISGTQRLVKASIQSINQFARELDLHQPA